MSSHDYTEHVLIEQPAIALFGGDLLLPKLISGELVLRSGATSQSSSGGKPDTDEARRSAGPP